MSRKLIHIEKVSVGFPKQDRLLKDLNLSVNKGDIIVLVGDNGAGKSTLLRTLCGLIKCQSGRIVLQNKPISEWNRHELAKKMAFVSSLRLNNQMINVQEFVKFGRYPYLNNMLRLSEEDKAVVEASIKSCGISHLVNKQLGEISDGERQKVALARAFAQQTDLLLLDEPTTHLDLKNTGSVFKLLKQFGKESGKSILFSSHQVEKALKIADHVWLVANKTVVSFTVNEFLRSKEFKEMIEGS